MNWDEIKKIIIIGISADESRDSNKVAKYFIEKRIEIIPVNPKYESVLGIKCYNSLEDVPLDISNEVDMIDIFRKSEFVLPLVKYVINNKNNFSKLKVIWMQEGVEDITAYNLARGEGYEVIMNSCAMIKHSKLTFKL